MINIKELKNRGFQDEYFLDMGLSLVKEYKGENYHYGIIISSNGSVLLTNYDETKNAHIFCLNLSKEFANDLLFILDHLKKVNQ